MKDEQRRARFGSVKPIGREDWNREVTEGSKADEEGEEEGSGTGVVVFLYKDACVFVDPSPPQPLVNFPPPVPFT